MKMKFPASFIVLLVIGCFASPKSANAQSDNRGTDFWVCFPQNAKQEFNAGLSFKLFITGDNTTKGKVILPGNRPSIPFSIRSGEVIGIDIDTSLQILGSGNILNLGVHIQSDQPIAVYGLSNRKASTDTYVAYPTNVLGTVYRALCYDPLAGTEDAFTSQIDVVATEDNTRITILPTANTKGGKLAGQQFTATLLKGDIYQIQGTMHGGGTGDLTGTLVTSDKPIAFFTGHICAQIPKNVNFCDQLLEEEAPVNTWGKQFFVSKLLGKDWYLVRIVANEDDTKIFINEKFTKSLAAGEYYEAQHLRDNVMIKSDKPILVGEFATSSDADSVKIGDPFLMLIAPTEQFLQSYRFVTPIKGDMITHVPPIGLAGDSTIRSLMIPGKNVPSKRVVIPRKKKILSDSTGQQIVQDNTPEIVFVPDNSAPSINVTGWHHYINVIIPIGAMNSLRLDSNGISSDKFTPIGITRYAIGQIEIPYGSHTITCDRPFGLYSYGFGIGGDNYDSYGNSAGQRIAPIERTADTSKPTLEIAQSDAASDITLIARDDRINDLGLASIMITDSTNQSNPVSYPVFDAGAPEFRFIIKKPALINCMYIKLQDFAKNQSFYALCPAAPNSSEAVKYILTPVLLQQQNEHEVYPVEIYPSPATYGQTVTINFINSLPEIIGVQVLDEGGNIVTELQPKQPTGNGKHSLIYKSDKYSAGSYFLRFTTYSSGDQVVYKQDAHFVVVH